MRLKVNGEKIYLSTGGQVFKQNQPTVIFLPGSGLDHRTWALQTRWFAFHGFNVIAPDFPAHSLSQGNALADIESMGKWIWQLLDELRIDQCSLIGHSQGGLVALEAAAQQPERVRSVSFIACAASIAVNKELLNTAANDTEAAASAMLNWGFGSSYQFGHSQIPGQAPIAIGLQIMRNNPLYMDLQACQNYLHGGQQAASLSMPTQLILAKQDRMTPIKNGRALAQSLPDVQSLIEINCGHMIPMESPDTCLHALQAFHQGLLLEEGA